MKFFVLYEPKVSRRWQGHLLAAAIGSSLTELGHEAVVASDIKVDTSNRKCTLVLVSERAAGRVDRWDGDVCLYNVTEACFRGPKWRASFNRSARKWRGSRIDCVWDYSPNNLDAFSCLGLKSVFMPIGYHPAFEVWEGGRGADVGFLGMIHHDSRREVALDVAKKFYNVDAKAYQGKGYAKADDVRRIIAARVFLHIHAHPKMDNFAGTRIIQLGMSNCCAIVAERSSWYPTGLEPQHHFLEFENGDFDFMVAQISFLIENEVSRIQMATRAYNWVKSSWRFVDHVGEGLQAWKQ